MTMTTQTCTHARTTIRAWVNGYNQCVCRDCGATCLVTSLDSPPDLEPTPWISAPLTRWIPVPTSPPRLLAPDHRLRLTVHGGADSDWTPRFRRSTATLAEVAEEICLEVMGTLPETDRPVTMTLAILAPSGRVLESVTQQLRWPTASQSSRAVDHATHP